jgi:acyl-CoA oxidase
MYDLKEKHGLTDEEFEQMFYLFGEDLPIQLQVTVFLPCLKALASEEQLAKWLPLAQRYEMIGSYAQTELAHGSNVAGLQTEARYDPERDEFVINTPHPDATKWWIGQLGKCANHTVLFAQLLMPDAKSPSGYKSLGPHPFLVQVRSYEDHTVLPGITVGDIGPKMGFAALDNGFISFKDHRIPRANMLARYSKIDPETKKYIPPTNAKLLYGSMLAVRVGIVSFSSMTLQVASTVSIRYSSIRRQFADPSNGNGNAKDGQTASSLPLERQVIDYTSQQFRILPQMATAYAMFFVGRWMSDLFKRLNGDFARGDFSLLPAMHATSSGIKALLTNLAADGLETCRLACGGHGYSLFSGLPMIYTSFVHVSTAEGENWLLNQQTVRQLLKLVQAANTPGGESEFHPLDPANYLLRHKAEVLMQAKCAAKSVQDWHNPAILLDALEHRATRLLGTVALGLREAMATMSPSEAWNSQLIEIHSAARAHCFVIMASVFISELAAATKLSQSASLAQEDNVKLGEAELVVLRKVAALFALYVIDKDLGQFTEDQFVSAHQASDMRKALKQLLVDIRSQAVPLVDAFAIPDYSLNSALGQKNGQAYATMLHWAKTKEPLNKTEVLPAFKQHLMPLVHKHRAKL